MKKKITPIYLREFLCVTTILISCSLVKGQIIQRGEIAIPDSSPFAVTDFIYEEGTAITKLDSGCFAIGGQIVYSTTAIQTRTAEQLFICKIDSQFNVLWTDTFRYYGDYYPSHYVGNIFPTTDESLVFDADILLYGYDSLYYDFRSTLNKHSEQGARTWSKTFFTSSAWNFDISGSINYNDTFLVSGYIYDSLLGNEVPMLVAIDLAGDTLFTREYSSYVSNPWFYEVKIHEDLEQNLYLTIGSYNSSIHYILKIDEFGNVLSVDSILLGSPNIDFLFITSNRFLTYGYHQSLTFFDSTHAVIDSFHLDQSSSMYKFYALQNGSVIILLDTYNSVSIIPAGNYVFRFDTSGKFDGALRYNEVSNPGDFLNALTQVNDSVFIGTGEAWAGNFLDNALVLKFSIQKLTANITGSQNFICAHDSIIFSLPASLIYKWSTGETTQQITVTQPGDYFASVINNSGTLIFTDTIHIQVYPEPVVSLGNDTMICISQSIVLDAGVGFANYQWQDGSTGQTFNASSAVPDSVLFTVEVNDSNNCSATDTVQVIFDLCDGTGIMQFENNLFLSPNPSQGKVVIHSSSALNGNIYFSLYDLTGRKVLDILLENQIQSTDVSYLRKGVYQFRFTSGGKELKSGKFVLE
jgi:hypothetical protein